MKDEQTPHPAHTLSIDESIRRHQFLQEKAHHYFQLATGADGGGTPDRRNFRRSVNTLVRKGAAYLVGDTDSFYLPTGAHEVAQAACKPYEATLTAYEAAQKGCTKAKC